MTTNEQFIKEQIHNLIAQIKRYEEWGLVNAVESLRSELQWFYAALANEQDTTYPTL